MIPWFHTRFPPRKQKKNPEFDKRKKSTNRIYCPSDSSDLFLLSSFLDMKAIKKKHRISFIYTYYTYTEIYSVDKNICSSTKNTSKLQYLPNTETQTGMKVVDRVCHSFTRKFAPCVWARRYKKIRDPHCITLTTLFDKTFNNSPI